MPPGPPTPGAGSDQCEKNCFGPLIKRGPAKNHYTKPKMHSDLGLVWKCSICIRQMTILPSKTKSWATLSAPGPPSGLSGPGNLYRLPHRLVGTACEIRMKQWNRYESELVLIQEHLPRNSMSIRYVRIMTHNFPFTPATRPACDDNHLGTATISLTKKSYFQEKKTRSCVKTCFVHRYKKNCDIFVNMSIIRTYLGNYVQ